MSFLDTILRAKGYLEGQGRVSLRALRREFDLDDDLFEELVDVQQVATREGEILSWIGSAAVDVADTSTTDAAPVREPAGAAERRQLTVLFCDLVGSTRLAAGMDAEEWREVVRDYQEAATGVIDRFDGHVAQAGADSQPRRRAGTGSAHTPCVTLAPTRAGAVRSATTCALAM
jgi:hypothetical protein